MCCIIFVDWGEWRLCNVTIRSVIMINSIIWFCQKTARPFIETLTLDVYRNYKCYSDVVLAKIPQCIYLIARYVLYQLLSFSKQQRFRFLKCKTYSTSGPDYLPVLVLDQMYSRHPHLPRHLQSHVSQCCTKKEHLLIGLEKVDIL